MNNPSGDDKTSSTYLNSSLYELFKQVQEESSFEESIFTLEHAEMWVRLAVVDDQIAEQVYQQCSAILTVAIDQICSEQDSAKYQERLCKQALAMHYMRALGARHLLSLIYQNLKHHSKYNSAKEQASNQIEANQELNNAKVTQQALTSWFVTQNPLYEADLENSTWHHELATVENKRDGVSNFPPLKRLYAAETMAETALNLVHEIALSIDPIRDQLLGLVNSYLSSNSYVSTSLSKDDQTLEHNDRLRDWLWAQWREGIQDEAMLMIAYQSIKDRPQRAETLALRLALISPHLAEKACVGLQALPNDQKLAFAHALEKQLKRVGKIKLWVSCRTALAINKTTELS